MLSGISQQQRGALYGVTAYLIWGFAALATLRRSRSLRRQEEIL